MTSRRHRAGGDYASIVSVPVGSTLAETRRQLVLRTFASTNGDIDRTAKTLGHVGRRRRAVSCRRCWSAASRDGYDAGDDAEEDPAASTGAASPPVAMPADAPSPVGAPPAKTATAGRSRKTS